MKLIANHDQGVDRVLSKAELAEQSPEAVERPSLREQFRWIRHGLRRA